MQPEFRNVPPEKRSRVLNAAMEEFAAKDYKSANTDNIASKAGISKGLLFYYFKNKKSLYFALVRHAVSVIEREMKVAPATAQTDMFDYLGGLADKKCDLLCRNPALTSFSMRVFYGGGIQVGAAMNRYMLQLTDSLFEKYLGNVDRSRFKPGFTPRQAIDLLLYLTDGYLHTRLMAGEAFDADALLANYHVWQDMVRSYMYKE